MRLFLAIELPENIRQHLTRLEEHLRADARAGATKAAWVRPQNLHITLRFLGETTDDDAAKLCTALRNVSFGDSLHLHVTSLLCLPPRGPVRIIAANLAGDLDPLRNLHRNIESICHEMGFPTENRPYTPHITLARCRTPLAPSRRRPLIDRAATLKSSAAFQVRQFVLMQSVLGKEAAQYTPLARFDSNQTTHNI